MIYEIAFKIKTDKSTFRIKKSRMKKNESQY